jgi:NADH dehydrogenase (ubiquinone) 1 alpha subcomplex subunit 6
MTTIPARLARATRTSSNPTEARHRVFALYRDWYRSVSPTRTTHTRQLLPSTHTPHPPNLKPKKKSATNHYSNGKNIQPTQAPEICSLYALNISPTYFRHAIRQRFEANRSVTDPKVVDVLIAKERMEYQETMNCWKMNDQLLGVFVQKDGGRPVEGTFLQKFYQGESSVFRCFARTIFCCRVRIRELNSDHMRSGRDEQAARPAATGM